MEKKKAKRVTLELGIAASKRLEDLQDDLDETKVGVFKKAIELTEHVVKALKGGYELQMVRGEEVIPVALVGLRPRSSSSTPGPYP